jgi:mitogen-activated protein kinase kinase 1
MASAGAGDATPAPQSYLLHDGVFVKDNVAILPTGVTMKDAPRTFVVDPDALTLGDVLGRGASSYVQAAVHKPTGTPLALKIMSIYDKSRRGQLVREIQALYDADCDCLVSFYGAYLREGTIAIALEYMDCGTLARVAALAPGGRIPEPTVAAIAFQLLWALAYMRVEKRLHRDIKPSNVLISSAGQVKLSDFGLSAELKNSIGMAATFTGTCRYMSPERIQHSLFSFPADVWSFGLVLLEVALGRYPYPDASTYIEMAETIVESPAPTVLAAERGAFSADFVQFVASCLVKNPDERLPADILLGAFTELSEAAGRG